MSSGLPNSIALVRAGIDAGVHIGAQLYVSLRGTVIANEAIGLARPASSQDPAQPMTPDTLMVWLSAGKPLTAVAIGQLVDSHQLAFDDPVVKFIPEFAPHGKDAVTIHHLLTHTVGLRTIHTDWPRATWDETLAILCPARMEKDWRPGQRAGYNAYTTWYLLGEIARRITGKPIAPYLHDALFAPLGMTESFLAMTAEEYERYRPRLGEMQRLSAAASGPARIEPMKVDTLQAASNPRPAGGIRGPVQQLGLLYEALWRARNGESTLIAPAIALQMTSRTRTGIYDETFKANIDWALGFQINSEHITPNAPYSFGPHASRETFGHGGFQASIGMCDPAHGLVVAAVFNGCPGEARHHERMRNFLTTLYEELRLS